MTEAQRKALYGVATAVLAALGAWGLIDAPTQGSIAQVVASALTLASMVAPLVAHRHTPSPASEVAPTVPAAVAGEVDPDIDVPDPEPQHADVGDVS